MIVEEVEKGETLEIDDGEEKFVLTKELLKCIILSKKSFLLKRRFKHLLTGVRP